MTRVQKKELVSFLTLVLSSSVLGVLFSVLVLFIVQGSFHVEHLLIILKLGFCTGFFVSFALYIIGKSFDRYAPLPLWFIFFVQPLIFAIVIATIYGSFFVYFLGLEIFLENSFVIETLIFSFLITATVIFFENLERLLGQKVLRGLIFGTYHKPINELRFVMFLDIAGSTSIAEKLGDIRFHSFLNDFFCDISTTILNRQGQIYKYVGDEVIITWSEKDGKKDQAPLAVFFDIDHIIRKRADFYTNCYGVVPVYRAGLHFGSLVAGEMGLHKQEIAFSGDVMNTTSRIQSECRSLGERFLVSSAAIEKLCPSDSNANFAPLSHVGPQCFAEKNKKSKFMRCMILLTLFVLHRYKFPEFTN